MAVTRLVDSHAASNAVAVQVLPRREDFEWRPRAGQVLVLLARYAPGVFAVAPSGWTEVTHEPRVLWKGREVAATCWWLQLQRDYIGWRHAGWYWYETEDGWYEGDNVAGLLVDLEQLFELPAVTFSRVNLAEVDFCALDGIEPPTLIDSGTAIGIIDPD